uniref:C-type lectin domain-containing protein n=1 Tax=Scleropages formosus TaxID=113540 RepID=A0A8C9RJ33_SCLFO
SLYSFSLLFLFSVTNIGTASKTELLTVFPITPMGNTSATQGCPSGWHRFKSRCFHYVSQKTSWADAQVILLHASLASIHRTDAPQEGKWIWVDGTPFDFTKWAPGQPDNYGGEHCLDINAGDQKLWNDSPCNMCSPSVCAKPVS